jgi:hypothetical protein
MPADNSQAERLRRLKGMIQAANIAVCPTCPELGPQGPTDQTTRMSRLLGQSLNIRKTPAGITIKESCCPTS